MGVATSLISSVTSAAKSSGVSVKGTVDNPGYAVYIVSGSTKYNVTPALISLDFSDQKTGMAQSLTVKLLNIKVKGSWLSDVFKVRDRIYVHAADGSKAAEVYRGFVWTRTYDSGLTTREITLRCYDNLIYLQESDDSLYFEAGKSTSDVCSSICNNWGVKLNYSYSSITHEALALRGNLSDIFMDDILDKVKDKTGKKYVILSDKDTMHIKPVGSNTTVYHFKAAQNAIATRSECTMDGMVTKVVILGTKNDSDHYPVEASVTKNTDDYGTLQKTETRSEDTTLEDAKKEAENILKEKGSPKWEYELQAPDVPWIRKGDKVYVNAGDIAGTYLIAVSVDRIIDGTRKTMTLTLEKP